MLELSRKQMRDLYDFILTKREYNNPESTDLADTLSYIMSNVDVRKTEQIFDKRVRDLVRFTFELIKNDYLLDNLLISPLIYQDKIAKIQNLAKEYSL